MKRGSGHIAALFGKYEAKKFASSESPSVAVDLQAESTPRIGQSLQFSDSPPPVDTSIETETDAQPTTTSSPHLPSGESADTYLPFECDPAKRIPISSYDANDQDDVRRRYIAKGPNNLYSHDFPVRKIYGKNRRFSCAWFMDYHWLEYSVSKDAGFCFVCYLFKARGNGGPRGDAFINGGWRIFYKPDALLKHVGGVNSIHNQAQEKYNLFVTPNTSIDNVIVKVSKEDLRLYMERLTQSLRCLRFLLQQGLAFRGRIISMYPTILEVLTKIGEDHAQKFEWTKVQAMVISMESFEFAFHAHLMLVVLGHTNELSQALQKRDQDIVNAMGLVKVAKNKMQGMRTHGWEEFLAKVTLFCNKHGIEIPLWDDTYVPHGRSLRFYDKQTNDDHFRRKVYLGVVDHIIQELDNWFDEVNMELLICMSSLNPTDSFASYDLHKVMRLAEFYPKDISTTDLVRLEFQLVTFIDDMRKDDRFKCLKTLGELSIKLVETKKHVLYDLVYLLLKMVLILPVSTAMVERVFSSMSLVKTRLRNSMGDDLLNYCLVTYIERSLFLEVSEDDLLGAFMAMRRRKVYP